MGLEAQKLMRITLTAEHGPQVNVKRTREAVEAAFRRGRITAAERSEALRQMRALAVELGGFIEPEDGRRAAA